MHSNVSGSLPSVFLKGGMGHMYRLSMGGPKESANCCYL